MESQIKTLVKEIGKLRRRYSKLPPVELIRAGDVAHDLTVIYRNAARILENERKKDE